MGNTLGSVGVLVNEVNHLSVHPYHFSDDENSNPPGRQVRLVGVQNYP